MNRQGRRQFLRTSLTLAGLSLLSGCGVVSLPGQPASRGTKVPRIGYLAPSAAPPAELEAFRAGLRELGYTEGQNIAIEVRLAESSEQVPTMAAELVALPVDLIVSAGTLYTQAVMGVTRTIPIVFPAAPDPVRTGFVASLARPGGNVTGMSAQAPQAMGKRLQMLRELAPSVSRVMFLTNATASQSTGGLQEVEQAAQLLGMQLMAPDIITAADLGAALQMAVEGHAEALLVSGSPLLAGEVRRIVEFARAQRLPVLAQDRIFPDAGGLLSYGPNRLAQFRRAASYVDRILKGANPAEMPVEQPTEFDLVINLKTAQALGLTIPRSVLDQATEIIQ